MNIKQAHNLFLKECTDGTLRRRSSATMKNYVNSFNLFMKITKISEVYQINEATLRMFFRVGEDKRKWKASTVITHRKNLTPFIAWCITKRLLPNNPLEKIPIPRLNRKLPEYYTDKEMEAIIYCVDMLASNDFLRARNKAIIGVLSLTGMRRGEILGLRLQDVDFEKMMIRVRAEYAKDREDRMIPMSSQVAELLRSYISLRFRRDVMMPWLWLSEKDERFTAHGLKHLVQKISNRVGFHLKTHKFRHTFATNHCRSGGDILTLQQILGHADVGTTTIYAHVMPEHLRGSVEMNQLNSLF